MFAYCNNNPVNMSDETGHWPKWLEDAVDWVNNNIFNLLQIPLVLKPIQLVASFKMELSEVPAH